MTKVINEIENKEDSSTEVKHGMFFKTDTGNVYMVVRIDYSLYLVGLETGNNWNGDNEEGMTVGQIEESYDMKRIYPQSIILK